MDWLSRLKKEAAANIPTMQPTLADELSALSNDGKDLPHYCKKGNGWCSEKLPESNYPAGCVRLHCEHYHASQDAPQTTTEVQGLLALAP